METLLRTPFKVVGDFREHRSPLERKPLLRLIGQVILQCLMLHINKGFIWIYSWYRGFWQICVYIFAIGYRYRLWIFGFSVVQSSPSCHLASFPPFASASGISICRDRSVAWAVVFGISKAGSKIKGRVVTWSIPVDLYVVFNPFNPSNIYNSYHSVYVKLKGTRS